MGLHHTIRLPTYGRCLAYHAPSADALIGCTGQEVFRFNLEAGRHMQPLVIGKGLEGVDGIDVVDVNKRHGLLSLGLDGGGGVVEFWDPRSKSALTRLLLPAEQLLPAQSGAADGLARPEHRLAVTALASHPTDGLSLAVGTSTGHTLLYDLRSPTPFAVKDQGYGEAMITVDWLRGGGAQEGEGRVVSADSKVIKVWNKEDVSGSPHSVQTGHSQRTRSPLRTSFPYILPAHSSTCVPFRIRASSSARATLPSSPPGTCPTWAPHPAGPASWTT